MPVQQNSPQDSLAIPDAIEQSIQEILEEALTLQRNAVHPDTQIAPQLSTNRLIVDETTFLEETPEVTPEVTTWTCIECNQTKTENDAKGRGKKWDNEDERYITGDLCEECIDEQDYYACNECEIYMLDDELFECGSCGDDNRRCEECYNLHRDENHEEECSHCGDSYASEDMRHRRLTGESEESSLCPECYGNLFYDCDGCGETHEIENRPYEEITNGPFQRNKRFCREYMLRNGDRFFRCSVSGKLCDKLSLNTYVTRDGRFLSERAAQNLLTTAQMEESVRAMALIREEITENLQTVSTRRNNRSVRDLMNRLENKSYTNLRNTRQPEISPAHNRIYVGMEIEAVGGRFFKSEKSDIVMGPNKMLSIEMPKYTKVVRDGSIRGDNGQEFLPPVVKKDADWNKIQKVVESLKEFGWQTNDSCGLHFHFSHAQMTSEYPDTVRNVFRLFYHIEPIIYKCMPPSRKNNEYCQPLSKFFTREDIDKNLKLDYWYYANFWKKRVTRANDHNAHPQYYAQIDNNPGSLTPVQFGEGKFVKHTLQTSKNDHYYNGRYIGCNLHSLFTKSTIELRYFPAVIDFTYIYAWAKAMQAVFQYALDKKPVAKITEIMDNGQKALVQIEQLGKEFGWDKSIIQFIQSECKQWQFSNKSSPGNRMVQAARRSSLILNPHDIEALMQGGSVPTEAAPVVHNSQARQIISRNPIPVLREVEPTNGSERREPLW